MSFGLIRFIGKTSLYTGERVEKTNQGMFIIQSFEFRPEVIFLLEHFFENRIEFCPLPLASRNWLVLTVTNWFAIRNSALWFRKLHKWGKILFDQDLKLSKNGINLDKVFYALGATDELSSALGLAREFASDVKNQKVIEISKSKALYIFEILLWVRFKSLKT